MYNLTTRSAAALVAALTLAGCVTEPQADGSTKVNVSLANLIKPVGAPVQASSGAAAPGAAAAAPKSAAAAVAPGIRTTRLAGLFKKSPYDGTPKTYFPRVAVTVTDWSRSDCWTATATIWTSKTKSEAVQPFSVCWGQSLGFAVNNAAHMHMLLGQSAVEHTGNVRTNGPKPPMLVIPDRQPVMENQQLAFQGFLQQLVLDTGWAPGAPTNMWLVDYKKAAPAAAAAAPAAPAPAMAKGATSAKPASAKVKLRIEQSLSCANIFTSYDAAEAWLKQVGWRDGETVVLPQALKVYGLTTTKVAVFRDSGEHTYRSYFPGVSMKQLVKAASLKLGKDGLQYGRSGKGGVLTAATEGGETTLTCTVDTEGSYE